MNGKVLYKLKIILQICRIINVPPTKFKGLWVGSRREIRSHRNSQLCAVGVLWMLRRLLGCLYFRCQTVTKQLPGEGWWLHFNTPLGYTLIVFWRKNYYYTHGLTCEWFQRVTAAGPGEITGTPRTAGAGVSGQQGEAPDTEGASPRARIPSCQRLWSRKVGQTSPLWGGSVRGELLQEEFCWGCWPSAWRATGLGSAKTVSPLNWCHPLQQAVWNSCSVYGPVGGTDPDGVFRMNDCPLEQTLGHWLAFCWMSC